MQFTDSTKALAVGVRRISEIQYIRAAASVAVLLFHASHYVKEIRGEGALFAVFNGYFGMFGVTSFFVISGYLMAELSQRTQPFRFLLHRIIRIYPIYWVMTCAVLLAYGLWGTYFPFDPWAFGLIPGDGRQYMLAIEWTLTFEISFYVAVFLVIVLGLRRWLPAIAMGWLLVVIMTKILAPEWKYYSASGLLPSLSYLLTSEKCIGFILGLLVPFIVQRFRPGPGALVASAGLILLSGALGSVEQWTMAGGCALLVAVAAAESGRSLRQESTTLVRMGDWSFALYLVHVPIILALLPRLPENISGLSAWSAVIGASLFGSVLLGKVDLWLYARLKQACDNAAPWVAASVVCVFLGLFLGGAIYSDVQERYERAVLREPTALGARLGSTSKDVALPVDALAEAAGLTRSSELQGFLDQFGALPADGSGVQIDGWALDRSGRNSELVVLLFADKHFVGSVIPNVERPDVLTALRLKGTTAVGFSLRLPAIHCAPGLLVEGLVVSGLSFAPLFIPASSICSSS